MKVQICPQCNIEKELNINNFFKNNIKKSGFDTKCKECRKISSKQYRIENREEVNQKHRETSRKNYNSQKKKQYYELNKQKILLVKQEYRKRNSEKIRDRYKNWRELNHDELSKQKSSYRLSIINTTLELLGSICVLCGESNKEFLTIDHLNQDGNEDRKKFHNSIGWKKRILTGELNKENYRVLCHNCNNSIYIDHPIHHLKNNTESGIISKCIYCNELKNKSLFNRNGCLDCKRKKNKLIKINCFQLLGNKCACCGESELNKLTVDHIDNDGANRRKDDKSGVDFYRKILNGKIMNVQLLCWNCNYSKHIGNGICFHQRKELINFSNFTITRDYWNQQIIKFLDSYHYAKAGRPSNYIYLIKENDQIIGIVKFASPVRQGIAASINYQNQEILELDRFCIHIDYHKPNFASWMMAKSIRLLKKDKPELKCLVSFADPNAGHLGGIYRASNWQEIGRTSVSYFYKDEHDNEINKRKVYKQACLMKITENEYVKIHHLIKVKLPPKIKFIYKL